jgi:enoyl-CoA hydratase
VLVALKRPGQLNAITFEVFDEFHRLCETVERNLWARVLVVTGSERGFCSGLDLPEAEGLAEMSAPEMLAGQENGSVGLSRLAVRSSTERLR